MGKAVSNALRKIQHELSQIKSLDPNGIAIFAGEYEIKNDLTSSTLSESYV